MDIGDIVRVDLESAANKEYWRELSEIDGVILAVDNDDVLVRWVKKNVALVYTGARRRLFL